LKKLLQGIFFGLSLILPGMSGGTAFVMMGMYTRVLDDLSSLNFKPYLIFGLGTGGGLLLWAFVVSHLLETWPGHVHAFLLGALWASAPLLLKDRDQRLHTPFTAMRTVYLLVGLLVGLAIAVEPLAVFQLGNPRAYPVVFLAGVISSATMLIPGVSGSAVLLILGMYYEILGFLRQFAWLPLGIFVLGCVLGILGLARLLHFFYMRYRSFFSFFVAGLIIGSGRTLFPAEITPVVFFVAAAGALIVTKWGGNN